MDETNVDIKTKFYSPLVTVNITLGIYFGSQVVGALALVLIGMLQGMNFDQIDAWLSDNVWTQFLFVMIVAGLSLGLFWQFMKSKGIQLPDIGINRPKKEHLGWTLIGYAIYFVLFLTLILVITIIFPEFDQSKKQELGFDLSTKGIDLLPVFISLVILPPIVEEVATRGFLFSGLRHKYTFIIAATVTSLLFAVAHLGATKQGLLWIAGIDTFILSMVMCYVRDKTGSLWPSMGMHFIKNSIAFVVLFNIVQYFR